MATGVLYYTIFFAHNIIIITLQALFLCMQASMHPIMKQVLWLEGTDASIGKQWRLVLIACKSECACSLASRVDYYRCINNALAGQLVLCIR